MKKWLKDKKIIDEYDRPVFYDKFVEFIEHKQNNVNNQNHLKGFVTLDKEGYEFHDGNFS